MNKESYWLSIRFNFFDPDLAERYKIQSKWMEFKSYETLQTFIDYLDRTFSDEELPDEKDILQIMAETGVKGNRENTEIFFLPRRMFEKGFFSVEVSEPRKKTND